MVCGGCLFGWAFWPVTYRATSLVASWPPARASSTQPGLMLTLQTPVSLRLGQSGMVVLTVSSDAAGEVGKTVLIEAGLELPGFAIYPAVTQIQRLPLNHSLRIHWQVTARRVAPASGVAPVNLRWYTPTGELDDEFLLAAPLFAIETITFFGLDVGLVRWLGGAAAVMGLVLLVVPPLRKA